MDKVTVLITFALEDDLVEQIRAISPERLEVQVLGQEARQLLRGLYPSQAEAAAVARSDLRATLTEAEIIFGFWGPDFHRAFEGAKSFRDVAPRLRWIQITSAGADRLLESGFLGGDVVVTNVSGLHATPIGEYVLGQMLMLAKGAHRFMRAQREHKWIRFMPQELLGKTVGIVGMGSIGEEVARLSRAFGMRVVASRRSVTARRSDDPLAHELLPPSDLHYLLGQSDFVVLALPLTKETRHLIGEAELRAMKPSAYIINIARGACIDEAALIRALGEGWIAGAGLDVFEREPLPEDSPLWDMENVIMSPHISGGTEVYNQRAVGIFTDNLRRYLAGEPLFNVIDPERGY